MNLVRFDRSPLIRLIVFPGPQKLLRLTAQYVELCEDLVREAVIWEAWRACKLEASRSDAESESVL